MSYLIQNFGRWNLTLRYTLRIRALFLIRSINLFSILLQIPNRSWSFTEFNSTWFSYNSFVSYYCFRKLPKILLPQIKAFRYTPIGLNLPKSAHYAALSQINHTLNWNMPISRSSLIGKSFIRTFINPYYTQTQTHISPISRRPMFSTLYKFMFLSLNVWFTWPKRYLLPSQLFFLCPMWYKLKFLNKYFFRIYSI